jgi:hypothetical protein
MLCRAFWVILQRAPASILELTRFCGRVVIDVRGQRPDRKILLLRSSAPRDWIVCHYECLARHLLATIQRTQLRATHTLWNTFMKIKFCLVLVALTGLVVCANAQTPRPKRLIVIPLEPYADSHWAFRATVKGHEELFVLDTGGGLTAISPEMAAEVGCEPWGQFTGFRMRGDRLDLKRCDNVSFDAPGFAIHLPAVGIWDFNKSLPTGAAPIAANVGLDAFTGQVITLDFAHRKLIIETPTTLAARIAKATEVPAHFIREVEGYSTTFAIGLDTAKGRVWMNIDSGDDAPIAVGRHIAAELSLDPNKKGPQPLDTMLAGGVALRGAAYVKDLIFDGNIGSPIVSNWTVTIDLERQRIWIAAKIS